MTDLVELEKRGAVAILFLHRPPANALDPALRRALLEAVARALADPSVKAMVLTARGAAFSAALDPFGYDDVLEEPTLSAVVTALENSDKPIVAALSGDALGGGLELVLGCSYRLAARGAKVGLPQVKAGVSPAGGGSQRLPRLVGIPAALDLVVRGEPIAAEDANGLGLVEEVVDGDLLAAAVASAQRLVMRGAGARTRDLTARLVRSRQDPRAGQFFEAAQAEAETRGRGARAPFRCIEAVRAARDLSFERGLEREAALFREGTASIEFQAHKYLFAAERRSIEPSDGAPEARHPPIARVTVLGAGTMGGGIAMALANAGLEVTLLDREHSLVLHRLEAIRRQYEASVAKGRLSWVEMKERLDRIRTGTGWEGIDQADLVVEAVFEDMALKRDVFRRLDQACRPDVLLASNTSTLDLDEIAGATTRPGRVVGLHFFSPAHVMRLVEIVRGRATSQAALAACTRFVRKLGKVGVVVGVCHGFAANRMLYAYTREAQFVVEEGALPEQVDDALAAFGFAMGPFATSDLAGLDVGWRVRKARPRAPGVRYSGTVADRLAEMGRHGQKTGAGFYRYEAGSRTPIPDPAVEQVIADVSRDLGFRRRPIGDHEIVTRCLSAMIGEGAKILEEGIAERAADLDLIWVHGYGFPAHRGGPMFYADTLGLDVVLAQIQSFFAKHGEIWRPSPLLVRLAREGSSFRSPLT